MVSTVSSASTAVDTEDMLQQYERLLFQLSQQVLEQQEEIRSLRAARQASQHGHHRRHIDSDGGSGGHKRSAVVISAESLSVSKGGRHHRTHNAAATEAVRMARTDDDSQLRLTLPLPSTPQVSSIGSAKGTDDHSVMGPSPESTARALLSPQYGTTGTAAPSWMHSVGKSSGQQAATGVLACSSTMCDVSSSSDKTNGGLTPSVLCDRPASGKTAATGAFGASSPESEVETSGGSSSLLRCRRTTAQWTQHAPLETPQVKFDGQDAMRYLLRVFSSAKSTRESDSAEAEVIAKVSIATPCERENGGAAAARSPNAPLQQRSRHVARRLFRLDLLEEDEVSENGSAPTSGGTVSDYPRPAPRQSLLMPSRVKRGDGHSSTPADHQPDGTLDEDSFWQERYKRIMACALAAEHAASDIILEEVDIEQQQQKGGEIRPCAPAVDRCRTTSPHDQSASATVARLLHLFTLKPTTRHKPETSVSDLCYDDYSFRTIA